MKRAFLVSIHATALALLSGCGLSLGNIDKPAPQAYQAWKKRDATEMDVKKALLECGAPHFASNGFIYEKALGIRRGDNDAVLNYIFTTDRCMERSGFVPRWDGHVDRYCSWDRHKHLAACQPNAIIPERSVERRLNSWHCQLHTNRDYCRQHAFVPAACDLPEEKFDTPPKECLP